MTIIKIYSQKLDKIIKTFLNLLYWLIILTVGLTISALILFIVIQLTPFFVITIP